MADTTGTDWSQLKGTERHGTAAKGQASDGTGATNSLAKFTADGSLTDGGIPANLLFNGGTGKGSIYGQIPRGTVDGSNTTFRLDYTMASPYCWLQVNGLMKQPPADGTGTNPNAEYSIVGATLTYNVAPSTGDWHYILYFINNLVDTTINAATLYLVSEHIPSSSGTNPDFGAGASTTPVYTIAPTPDWFHSTGAWSKRTDSLTLGSGALATLADGTFSLLVMLEHEGIPTGHFTPEDDFRIYDCYVTVTHVDTTTETWRPTAYTTQQTAVFPQYNLQNPAFAIDGDNTTFARLLASEYEGGGLAGIFLNLNTFVKV